MKGIWCDRVMVDERGNAGLEGLLCDRIMADERDRV